MKKEKKYIILTILVLIVILFISNNIYASNPIDNPDGYNPNNPVGGIAGFGAALAGGLAGASGDAVIVRITSRILTILSDIGVVVSVISIAIIGVKYMIGSADDKAKYKENIMPYIVGIILLFGISSVVKILQAIGNRISA